MIKIAGIILVILIMFAVIIAIIGKMVGECSKYMKDWE